jgi:hypothetical protein
MDNIKDLLKKYNLDNKMGLTLVDKKKCLCGEEMDTNVQICPKCGASLIKKNLLNVAKNTALAKSINAKFENNVFTFTIDLLLSQGFSLYESNALTFVIDINNVKVTISDTKYFKANGQNPILIEALDKYMPQFYEFIARGLKEQEYYYAVSNFSSLSPSQIENFLNIYANYNALIPYLRGYKVLNYGKSFNLKEFYPNVDFNSIEDIMANVDLYLPVLKTYEFKNVNYLSEIVNIYKTQSRDDLNIFNACIDKLLTFSEMRGMTYAEVMDVFSVLYNKEISFQDFLRIYLNSREYYFAKLLEVKKSLKKVEKKFSWFDVDGINGKFYGTLMAKSEMASHKISKTNINEIYKTLENNPTKALEMLVELSD